METLKEKTLLKLEDVISDMEENLEGIGDYMEYIENNADALRDLVNELKEED